MASQSKTRKARREWKRAEAEELLLPSENTALVKRPGMEAFIVEGIIPDSLMPIINEAVAKGQGLPPSKVQDMVKDRKTLVDMMDAMDRVVARVVQEPKVLWHKRYTDEAHTESVALTIEERKAAEDAVTGDVAVYFTDDVDFEDKQFIFNFAVGGTRDLEQFRQESSTTLASLSSGDDVAVPSK